MKGILIAGLIFGMVSLGYTKEKPMTEEEAQAKIQELQKELSSLDAEVKSLQARYDELYSKELKLDKKIENLRSEVENLKAEIAKYPSEYTVKKGDYLAKIAGMRYIYNNPKAWPRIYRANRDKIKDPNLIYPGWVLKIPHGIVKQITVIPGDCLWKIAGFSWIYDNPLEWPKIYEANKDKIKDPDLIYPGQVLDIPRD